MNAYRRKCFGLIWVSILIFSFSVFGQKATPTPFVITSQATVGSRDTRFETMALDSKLMGRLMLYRVILPNGLPTVGETQPRLAVVYLLHGLTGHYTNWIDKTKLVEYAAQHKFIIVTPEGDNGWYSDSVSVANDKYESYIVKELIPDVDKKFNTIADREHRVIAGLSMGGYGALKFGLKYPGCSRLLVRLAGLWERRAGRTRSPRELENRSTWSLAETITRRER